MIGAMQRGWQHFAHDADVGVRGIGGTLAEAFAEAARAMTAAAVDPDVVESRTPVTIACTGADPEDLLYAWLNALIYEMASRRMVFGRFDVEIDRLELRATAWGEPVNLERHQPAVEIKGATFTALAVRRQDGVWIAECVVDV
jgi:tRNA nucleotidyltransferase (CCA-adding enzyme)